MNFKKFLCSTSLAFAAAIISTAVNAAESDLSIDTATDTEAVNLPIPLLGVYRTDARVCGFRLVETPGTGFTFATAFTADGDCRIAGRLAYYKPNASGEAYISTFTDDNGTTWTSEMRPLSGGNLLQTIYKLDGSVANPGGYLFYTN